MRNGAQLFVGLNGIYDFTDEKRGSFPGKTNAYLRNHKTPELLKEISAYYQVPAKNPPAVITFHGTADMTIPYQQSIKLCEAITKAGGVAEAITYPNYTHSFSARNSSDKYEEVTLKLYEFASNILYKKR